jgi:hypothetical protein
MTDHLVERGNLRDASIALVIGLGLTALVGLASGCTPQQSAQLYPMMGVASQVEGMGSQASNLYFQQQNMQRQAELQRQQEYLLYLQQQRQNQHYTNGLPAD